MAVMCSVCVQRPEAESAPSVSAIRQMSKHARLGCACQHSPITGTGPPASMYIQHGPAGGKAVQRSRRQVGRCTKAKSTEPAVRQRPPTTHGALRQQVGSASQQGALCRAGLPLQAGVCQLSQPPQLATLRSTSPG